eukprot:3141740-Rhodomonas_salina.1
MALLGRVVRRAGRSLLLLPYAMSGTANAGCYAVSAPHIPLSAVRSLTVLTQYPRSNITYSGAEEEKSQRPGQADLTAVNEQWSATLESEESRCLLARVYLSRSDPSAEVAEEEFLAYGSVRLPARCGTEIAYGAGTERAYGAGTEIAYGAGTERAYGADTEIAYGVWSGY